MSGSTSLIKGASKRLERFDREKLIEIHSQYHDARIEWIRRAVLQHNRIDVLATEVLGYEVKPLHLAMMQWQFVHPESRKHVFRGAGKTTACTVTKAIHYLLKNPNLRILLASKTAGNSEAFLTEIKSHFENNKLLEEIFGVYYDPRLVTKWDNREINVLPRTMFTKESSITCVGVDTTIVSKHYDVHLNDDLVDEENTRTKYMRDKTRAWYYQTLDPTLEPPDPNVEHRGERHSLGTRYHFDDLYGHLMGDIKGRGGELKKHTQIIPALDDKNRSPWPEKYSPKFFIEKRKRSGTIIFNAQYLCDTEAMKGEVFQYDDCQQIEDNEIPTGLKKFIGVDLAIRESETADQFAIVCIGVKGKIGTDDIYIYVLDWYAGHIRFSRQTAKILEFYRRHSPIRAAIETNAYQLAQYQTLKDDHPGIRVRPTNTQKDKMTRAWKLSPLFENKRVFFRRGRAGPFIDQLVLFPNHRYKDLFDAMDIAVRASRMKTRKRRPRGAEPGLI